MIKAIVFLVYIFFQNIQILSNLLHIIRLILACPCIDQHLRNAEDYSDIRYKAEHTYEKWSTVFWEPLFIWSFTLKYSLIYNYDTLREKVVQTICCFIGFIPFHLSPSHMYDLYIHRYISLSHCFIHHAH